MTPPKRLPFDKRPKRSAPKKQQFGNSTIKQPTFAEKIKASRSLRRTPPIKKVNPEKRAKRAKRNQDYYKSAEWRAKKKAVHERDGYQCVESIPIANPTLLALIDWPRREMRCPNRGEVVNGKQTARGLVCEETSYGHRGIPDRIDTCKTRCKDCDRRRTPLERANHAHGFQSGLTQEKKG